MPIPCAVLMCHAPIALPEVAGNRARQCSLTTRAMTDIAMRLCAHAPDLLVIVSPHAPRHPTRWGICTESPLRGDFGRFGADHVGLTLPGAPEAGTRLNALARKAGLMTREIAADRLDHGALVPLHFVRQAGWDGPTLLIALPYPGTRTEATMGRVIAELAEQSGQRWAFLASGDMSHRLIPSAPSGYHPQAKEFDRTFKARIDAGDLRGACAVDADLREIAAEDVVDSCTVAAAAVDYRSDGHRTYGYEGPFGVGYLEAVLFEDKPPSERGTRNHSDRQSGEGRPWQSMLRIAREAIAAKISHSAARPHSLPTPWNTPQGVFVTLRDARGELRGCIGHVESLYGTLAEEIAACAAAAATQDTRFARVTPDELPHLTIEISLLSKPEIVTDLSVLDPKRYGVVVSAGRARGVLLPDIEGVDTIEEQLRIAAGKGHLPAGRTWTIERFTVQKECEGRPSEPPRAPSTPPGTPVS
jgi:MEMO1 family protein